MIIIGSRSNCARRLANYLLRRADNEEVLVREIENFPARKLTHENLKNSLRMMETEGQAKGYQRTLYHAMIALPQGETLQGKRLKIAVDTLATNLGLAGHQRVVVEHQKDGRQHFHIVFNCFDPLTGAKKHLAWKNIRQFHTARQLERELNLKTELNYCHSFHQWELIRGKRSGIDPFQMRSIVTGLYQAAQTGVEFVKSMSRAGYALTIGKFNTYVIVDRAGHIHGLMGRIQNTKLADLNAKFPDLKNIALPSLTRAQTSQRAKACRIQTTQSARAVDPIRTRASLPLRTLAKPPSLLLPPRRTNRVAQLMAYAQLSAAREKAGTLKQAALPLFGKRKRKIFENEPAKANFNKAEIERAELIAWAFENGRVDILAQFGIHMENDHTEAP